MNGTGNNLIEGGVVRTVLKLAAPTLAASVLQNMQSLIDMYWVGYLGSDALAAMAISSTIFLMVFPLILGSCSGAIALVSRSIGEGNMADAERIAGESWRLALLMGLGMGVVGLLASSWLSGLVGAEGVVLELCDQYLGIMFAGCFTAFVLFMGNSILQGAGNTFVPMVVMILANVINILLDPILIFGCYGIPAMGVRGAAIATVIAQLVSGCIICYLLLRGREGIKMRMLRPDRDVIMRLLRVGLPGSGQMLSRSLMSIVLMTIIAGLGMSAAAAYGVGVKVLTILLLPSFAIANAVATMVGQNLGAGMPGRAARAAWYSASIDAVLMLFAAGLLWINGDWIAAQFSDVDEVRLLCVQFMRIVGPFYVFVAFAIVLGRGFMGAGDAVPPLICTIVSLWGLQVPLALILPKYFETPVHGVWWASSIALSVHGILVAILFAMGRWKYKKV